MNAPVPYDIRPVLQDDTLHAWFHRGEGSRLVVSFAGIGGVPSATQGYEFARTATGNGRYHALFFVDPGRTWLNGEGLIDRIVTEVERRVAETGATQVITIGHSMGGFSAAVLPAFTRVDLAVCLSPQVSVHPDIVPDEDRWKLWRSRIATHRITSVADCLQDATRYYVFFGQHPREAPQRDRFPLGPNICLFTMPSTVHNTPRRMKVRGVLDSIIGAVFEDRTRLVRRIAKQDLNARQIITPTRGMLRYAKMDAARAAELERTTT